PGIWRPRTRDRCPPHLRTVLTCPPPASFETDRATRDDTPPCLGNRDNIFSRKRKIVLMEPIVLKQGASRWDEVSLGEVMLRLDPAEGRIHTTRHFNVWEGGGEYNVARGLRRCFGLRTAVATALADNPVG